MATTGSKDALAVAAGVLGTTTKKDTVNAALREVGQRLVRLRALTRLGEMADRGPWLTAWKSSGSCMTCSAGYP